MVQASKRRGRAARLGELLSPRFFKALCDPSRVALLVDLAGERKPCTVSQLAQALPVDLSVVSRHLATLRDAGIVDADRQGKEVRYRVRARAVAATLRAI